MPKNHWKNVVSVASVILARPPLLILYTKISKNEGLIFGHLFAKNTLEKRRFGSLRHFGAPPLLILYTKISKNEGQIFGHLFAEKTLEKRRFGSLRHFGAPPPLQILYFP